MARRRPGLTQKLALSFAIAILPVVALAALLIQRNAALADDQTRTAIMGAAQVAANEADNYISTAANELAVVAPVAVAEDAETQTLRYGRLYLERGDFLNVFAVDSAGRGMVTLFRANGRLPAISDTPLLAAVLNSRQPAISAASFPGVGRFPTILVAVPVLGPAGEVQRILCGSLSLGRLQLELESAASHRVLLIDGSGAILGPTAIGGTANQVAADYPPFVAARTQGHAGVTEYGDATGEWLSAYAPLETAPWTVVTVVPRGTAFLPTRALVESGILILLAAVIGSLIAAWILSRVMLRPVARLTQAARSLAGGDLGVRASVSSSDETRDLAIAFNSMADALSATIARLEAQRAETAAQAHDLRRLLARTAHLQEVERSRVAVDIHDGATQLMVGALFELDSLRLTVEQSDLAERLSHAAERVRRAIGAMRRVMFELHPTLLAQLGLPAALEQLLGDTFAEQSVTCKLDLDLRGGALSHEVEIAMFRVAQEALANVRHHARASHVSVGVRSTQTHVELRIEDDGCGFAVDTASLFEEPHLGLLSMNERALSVGGTLNVVSEPKGGTTVHLEIPTRQPPLDEVDNLMPNEESA